MYRRVLIAGICSLSPIAVFGQEAAKAEGDVVFRSDTALVRVDVQVLDVRQRPISGLEKEAFHLKEQGVARPVLNFVREEMPIDILFLIDVSGSMRPHVERMAEAAHDALPAMRSQDRAAVMVFDRRARIRMPFRWGAREASRELDNLLRSESFDGGTDIIGALVQASQYMKRQGRRDARRAIVMLTDDQTEFDPDEDLVMGALSSSNTMMSVLLVPPAHMRQGRMPPAGGGGGGWGGIIFGGPRFPGGGGYPPIGGGRGPTFGGGRTKSAGSAEIARESGGDSMQASEAYALENTLARLRQRYALHFNLPAGAREGEQRRVEVTLASTYLRKYPDAELRYRRTYIAAANANPASDSEPVVISGVTEGQKAEATNEPGNEPVAPPVKRRRNTDGSSSNGPVLIIK